MANRQAATPQAPKTIKATVKVPGSQDQGTPQDTDTPPQDASTPQDQGATPQTPAKTPAPSPKTTPSSGPPPSQPPPPPSALQTAKKIFTDPQLYETLAAAVIFDRMLKKGGPWLAKKSRGIAKQIAKLARKKALAVLAKSGSRAAAKAGIKGGEKLAEKTAIKAAEKAGTKAATQAAVAADTGPAAPFVEVGELAFNMISSTMDSLNLGGFANQTNMTMLNGMRDEYIKQTKEAYNESGYEWPVLTGPIDYLKNPNDPTDVNYGQTLITNLQQQIYTNKIKEIQDQWAAGTRTKLPDTATEDDIFNYFDQNIDMDATFDQATEQVCTGHGGVYVKHPTSSNMYCTWNTVSPTTCQAKWPMSDPTDTYYEFDPTSKTCQVKPPEMRKYCEGLNLGVTYNMGTGSCNLSDEYCRRYGNDGGVKNGDCSMSGAMSIAETIFGATITRSLVNIFDPHNYQPCKSGEITDGYLCRSTNCGDGLEKGGGGGLCYEKCRAGYSSDGASMCIKDCDSGWDRTGGPKGLTCAKQCPPGFPPPTPGDVVSCARPTATPTKPKCHPDEELIGLLCYPKCRGGYYSPGGLPSWCYQDCPNGWHKDTVDICSHDGCDGSNPDRGTGLGIGFCYPLCRSGYSSDGVTQCHGNCPSGYRTDPLTCWKDATCHGTYPWEWHCDGPDCKTRDSYSRGAGVPYHKTMTVDRYSRPANSRMGCDDGYHEETAGLCYKDTPSGYPKTLALLQRPTRLSDTYLRKIHGPSLHVYGRKRRVPFPSTSENDFKNSILGSHIQDSINAARNGDIAGLGRAMAATAIVSNPVVAALGIQGLANMAASKVDTGQHGADGVEAE